MHSFEINSIDDLVANASFQQWILSNDEEAGIYWNRWIAENPEKLEWVAAARSVIQVMAANTVALPRVEVEAAAAAIQQRIRQEDNRAPASFPAEAGGENRRRLWLTGLKWGIAASLLLAIVASVLIIQKARVNQGFAHYKASLDKAVRTGTTYSNHSGVPRTIRLPDGSEVTLEAGSSLVYAPDATASRRAVFLTGDAFFNVTSDPEHPFIVYTPNIVTRVLGTSFWVKAAPGGTIASVMVCSGKVSVHKTDHFNSPSAVDGFVLTPNQKAEYDMATEQINKALVDSPQLRKNDIAALNFEAAPVVQVFKQLEDAYGIPIVFDEQILGTCSVTAALDNGNFYEKLKTVCKIIDATYEIIDGTVVISAKGCK